jgi:hypothetical protein
MKVLILAVSHVLLLSYSVVAFPSLESCVASSVRAYKMLLIEKDANAKYHFSGRSARRTLALWEPLDKGTRIPVL